MALSLVKGQNTALDSSLTKVVVGLGWDPRKGIGASFDLDASAFMLGANGKARSDDDFIYFGRLKSKCGSIKHLGDNLTGDGDGDDEQIVVDLTKVPVDVERVVFTVTIYKASERKQNFSMVANAFIRIVDSASKKEFLRYELSEEGGVYTTLVFGELYKRAEVWKFRALGQGYDWEIYDAAKNFGVYA